ncbi:L-ectoine synthase [Nematostella vectensis]|uniref:L-ectoine synthase n=1 Tax=Nematostella vectensis TaxID=45351 RepID=UPI0020770265|nr:L-ectoine synthase [Nematostella vectensis]
MFAEVNLENGFTGTLIQPYDEHNHLYYFVQGKCEVAIENKEIFVATADSVLALSWETQASIKVLEHARIVIVSVPRDPAMNPASAVFRTMKSLQDMDRWVDYGKGISRRFFTRKDGFNITVTNTTIAPNEKAPMQYRHHYEANFMVRGSGSYTWNDGASTQAFNETDPDTRDGVMYLLDDHDAHVLTGGPAGAEIVLAFFPALEGDEVHDFSGGFSSY